MRNLTFNAIALASLLAACSKTEEQPPAPSAPPAKKVESAKPAASVPAAVPSAVESKVAAAAQPAMTKSSGSSQLAASLENAYISNPDFSARVETIYKLADAGTPEAISSLGRLFHMEKDPDLKTEILDSLFDIDGQDESKAALLAAGAGTDQPKDVRQSAIEGLEDVKPEIALPILKALASDPDPDISEAAKDSLETVQEQPAQPN
jgi:hypothetical protein